MELVLSNDDVEAASRRLRGVVHTTPVLTSRTLDSRTGGRILLKAECYQRTGSFKIRGAYNAIASLPPEARARGVAAYSSGNHAQAVALAARLLDTSAVILMPADSPPAKLEATRGYGAEVVTYDRYSENREALGEALADERGCALIRPYDAPAVMAGQGTVAREFLEQVGNLDVLVVPVGGGGLIAGCATAASAGQPELSVVGVEPATGDDTRRSLVRGERVRLPLPDTIADGLQAPEPGELTFAVNRRLVTEVVTVSDEEILEAMAFLFDRLKVVVEPSGAVGVAALLSDAVDIAGRRVGVVLSGGNVGVERFCALLGGNGLMSHDGSGDSVTEF